MAERDMVAMLREIESEMRATEAALRGYVDEMKLLKRTIWATVAAVAVLCVVVAAL